MELLTALWEFSTSQYGFWLWMFPPMIALGAWSDWRDKQEHERWAAEQSERIRKRKG